MKRIVIVGASLAGLCTARALRAHGFDGELVLAGAEAHRPYDRPPLSKEFLAGQYTEEDLTLEGGGEDLSARWLLGRAATGLDPVTRTVRLDGGATLRADGIVLATGAVARELPGHTRTGRPPGMHTLRTLEDARALRADLTSARRLVIVGAGFIGAEVASTARAMGVDVTVVEALPTPLAGPLGIAMGATVAALHAEHGTTLICGAGVDRVTAGGAGGTERVDGVLLRGGRHLPADVVVVGVGSRPAVDWLAGSGLTVEGGVHCDAHGATGAPGIVAVGDCASWYDPDLGVHHRIEHWTSARERARTAAATLLGAAPPAPAPAYFWSEQYGARIQFAGHALPGDDVSIEDGDVAGRSFLAVYRRPGPSGRPVAVLGMNRTPAFSRWRRRLAAPLPLEAP
ncbi:NAD(P)/FAD-dependent oxidoreductase [Dactylosporangium sp. NBC_01737]|uniref:NAD(P)/FAD-dependent oxidoreductase n=1 Tax=Dactylosporangium sp. NBC_01737 TaxID=2975959 RepID=UPI002E14C842|nr:NAD(P)/FAD-dependent oxidoreductase [Dactylosporangium sp. NBC_01737]